MTAAFLGVAAVIVVAFSVPLLFFVARIERERGVTQLERDAFILAGHAKETLATGQDVDLPSLEPYITESAGRAGITVVVTNPDGVVVAASDAGPSVGSDFSNRPEVATAMAGDPAVGERRSETLGENLVFVAVPVLMGETVLGVVRLSQPDSVVDEEVRERILGIVAAGVLSLLVAAGVAVPLALGIIRPVERLRRGTEALSGGDFSARAEEGDGPEEIRELARSFNLMATRVGAIVESQRQFAGLVSHQFRTPLTVLRLRLEQLQDGPEDAPARDAALEAARSEIDRMNGLIEQLLVLSRLEGDLKAATEVDAVAVARDRVAMWGALAAEHGVSVELVGAGEARCRVLAGGLEQIIDNFIDNALSVAPRGSSVVVEVSREGREVIVDVIDRGPGMTDAERNRAFDRFWRGSASASRPGTGLGLAIVRQIALVSAGRAVLLGDAGGGTRARVVLPAG